MTLNPIDAQRAKIEAEKLLENLNSANSGKYFNYSGKEYVPFSEPDVKIDIIDEERRKHAKGEKISIKI